MEQQPQKAKVVGSQEGLCPERGAAERARSWAELMPDELAERKRVEEQVLTLFGEGIDLLHRLSIQAYRELASTHGVRVRDGDQHFRLLLLTQSVDVAWNLVNAITSGYPRIALTLARPLREGHIAVFWATLFREEARARWNQIDAENPLGDWPRVGQMAQEVERELESLDPAKAEDWSYVLKAYEVTHNKVFAHAVSNFALNRGVASAGEVWEPLGPSFNEDLTRDAINHSVPLFALLLHDAAKLAQEILSASSPSRESQALAAIAERYMSIHRVPVWLPSDFGK